MKLKCDLAVIGSGFGGSLLSMIAQQLGRSVVLLEKDRHPRFAIGESSTPLANLILENLADRYRLPTVRDLAKFGTWQTSHPELACGLKRGFSFYHHREGRPWTDNASRGHQLLVEASPHDDIADTHWYRPDFDHHLVQVARQLGVRYFDLVRLDACHARSNGTLILASRDGQDLEIEAGWVFDATGPRGFLHRQLSLSESAFPALPDAGAIYTHFRDVQPWQDLMPEDESPPYPVDAAAMHHVFPGGWIWVLRFNNGITSAGAACQSAWTKSWPGLSPEEAWRQLLKHFPSIAEQFANAKAEAPWHYLPQLSFRSEQVAGNGWSLLPATAGFVDPLLSTGFTLNLLGLERLAGALAEDWGTPNWPGTMQRYQAITLAELDNAANLLAALTSQFHDFPMFATLTRLYFTAVSYTETARRLGKPELAGSSFLLADRPDFDRGFQDCSRQALDLASLDPSNPHFQPARQRLFEAIDRTIAPYDVAGLTNPKARHWFPVRKDDLLNNRAKLRATQEEIEIMLQRCGF